ncbi:hypothetical protein PoB_004751700 [Plakobranchus ocellatus]|uniref:Uncharacterized protein n=1 Tax=Plakobranchus ocellatus TaxID=259542 RepID=A0AAV4BNR9_9GAST|nr:hypothetical protein PoB_004751700 [Plakobranchus ocellatus]
MEASSEFRGSKPGTTRQFSNAPQLGSFLMPHSSAVFQCPTARQFSNAPQLGSFLMPHSSAVFYWPIARQFIMPHSSAVF